MTYGPGRIIATRSLLVLAASAAMLSACGSKQTGASNAVEMRDMEVIDGTTNDAMTDLDAVRSNGMGLGENESGEANTAE